MSIFRDAKSITDAEMFFKVLVYAPRGWGKTHFALSAPEPAVLDLENRAHHFRSLFDFKIAGIETLDSVREGFREILSGRLPCKTIVIDSNSAMYQRLVDKYTSPNKDGKPVTDYVLVNKDMLAFTSFVFGIHGKNVIFTAHQVDKLIRNGNQFQKDGVKGKYDAQIEYGFDFILRGMWDGNRRIAIVEKSVYASALPVGSRLPSPSFAVLMDAIKSVPASGQPLKAGTASETPVQGHRQSSESETAQGSPIAASARNGNAEGPSAMQRNAIDSIVADKGLRPSDVARAIRDINADKSEIHELSHLEAGKLILALPKLVAA